MPTASVSSELCVIASPCLNFRAHVRWWHPSWWHPTLPVVLDHKTPKRLWGQGKGCGAFSLGLLHVLGRKQNVAQGCQRSDLDRAGKRVSMRMVGDETMKTTCNVGKTKACGSRWLSLCSAGLPVPSFTSKTMKKRAESCLTQGLLWTDITDTRSKLGFKNRPVFFFFFLFFLLVINRNYYLMETFNLKWNLI